MMHKAGLYAAAFQYVSEPRIRIAGFFRFFARSGCGNVQHTLGTVLLGMQYEIVDGFTGMGVVKIALPLSVFRKVVFFACIFILPRFLPIEQIFFCEPISDIFPPLVSVLVYALTIKRVINRGPQKQTAQLVEKVQRKLGFFS